MTRATHALLRVLGTVGALGTIAFALGSAGDGAVAMPHSLAEAGDTLGHTDPIVLVFALLRLVALGLCLELLVTTVAGALARLAGLPRLVRLLDRGTLPVVRHLLRGVATAGAMASLVPTLGAGMAMAQVPAAVSASSTSSASSAAEPPILHRLPDEPATTGAAPPTSAAPSITLRQLDDPPLAPPAPAPPPTPAPEPADHPPAVVPASTTSADAPAPEPAPAPYAPDGVWVIAPGDHLWHVSVATLTAARGSPPSDAATATYLQALIARNASVFAVPGDPDLVFPGQRFELPPVS